MSIESRAFRDAMGCFATGVTIISTVTPSGEQIGITVNSFNSVSLEPPLVLYSLARSASRFDDFLAARHFVINVLGSSQREISSRFATHGVTDFEGIPIETWETGAPVIKGGLSAFECSTEAQHDGGDHVIVVGRVNRVACVDENSPLLYFRGRYAGVVEAPD